MSAVALHHRPHVGPRTFALVLAVCFALLGAGLVADHRWEPASTETVRTITSPTDAVGAWLVAHRAEELPGAAGGYLGTCPTDAPGYTTGICSALVEDLGDVQIHLVGPYATDWGADLLLERTSRGWTVAGVSRWPELGVRYDGPPWSPLTAITTWWFDRAAARYGEGAVHLRSCAEATSVADARTGQPLLCSTLVRSGDGVRVYESGLVGRPPDVRLTLEEAPDHTWAVSRAVDL